MKVEFLGTSHDWRVLNPNGDVILDSDSVDWRGADRADQANIGALFQQYADSLDGLETAEEWREAAFELSDRLRDLSPTDPLPREGPDSPSPRHLVELSEVDPKSEMQAEWIKGVVQRFQRCDSDRLLYLRTIQYISRLLKYDPVKLIEDAEAGNLTSTDLEEYLGLKTKLETRESITRGIKGAGGDDEL